MMGPYTKEQRRYLSMSTWRGYCMTCDHDVTRLDMNPDMVCVNTHSYIAFEWQLGLWDSLYESTDGTHLRYYDTKSFFSWNNKPTNYVCF